MTTKQTPPTAEDIIALDDAEEILRRLGDPAAAATVRDARTMLEEHLSVPDARTVERIRSTSSALRATGKAHSKPSRSRRNKALPP